MFVTFPLRKPWWTLLILLILFLAPTFAGVKPAEVHLWYWGLLKKSTAKVSDKAKNIVAEIPKIEVLDKEPKTFEMVEMESKSSGRKMFEKAKSAPIVKKVNITDETNLPIVQSAKKTIAETTTMKKKLNLRYLDKPEKISGMAVVINANEIKVWDATLFLHGVYVSPYDSKGKRAKSFLIDIINGKNIECLIQAYTYQSIPTAICEVDGVNINRQLVDLGYSKNVALD